ncbi:MAG: hypothetical protein ACYTGX_13680, partial [Planctomycetota bacterium]
IVLADKKPGLGSKAKKYAKTIMSIYHTRNQLQWIKDEYPSETKAIAKFEEKIAKYRSDLEGLENHNWKGLAKALNATPPKVPWREKQKGKSELAVKIDGHPAEYLISGGSAKMKPLMVALHGGGAGVGNPSNGMGIIGNRMKSLGCVAAAPKAPGLPNGAWAYPRGYRTIKRLIQEVGEQYNIDYNRLYVGGHSMGGYGGFWNCVWWPDRWAACLSSAGGISAGAVNDFEICHNTPLFVIHGTLDKQGDWETMWQTHNMLIKLPLKMKHYKFVKLDGVGHGIADKYHQQAAEWMIKFTRDPYPTTAICTASRVFNIEDIREMPGTEKTNRCFWIEILGKSGAHFNDGPAKVKGEYDPKTNTITVTTPVIQRVMQTGPQAPGEFLTTLPNTTTRIGICLSDEMVDLDQPVKITCNGQEVHNGPVERNVDFLLDSLVRTGDPAMPFAARIDFNVP